MQHTNEAELAMNGGPKIKTTPFGEGKRFGAEEKQQLMEVIDSDMLFYFMGTKVYAFQDAFKAMYNMKHCVACSSGTAAVHIAVSTLELPPGTEVITSAITDMGSLTGILYQGLIPVFADIDSLTFNMSPASVEERITARTGAIVVVHHAGLAVDMDAMMAVAAKHNIPIVEDCAQAYLCDYRGQLAGTMGTISAFSLNHFKHITCGSGGMVLTNHDRNRKLASLFLDKCYDREEGERNPGFLAPNYQMTELQGAVALAQLGKLEGIVRRRESLGNRLSEILRSVPDVTPQRIPKDQRHTYFMFLFRVDLDRLKVSLTEFSNALAAEGVPNKPHAITGGMCEYQYDIFRNRSAFPGSQYPFVSKDLGTHIAYKDGLCPEAEKAFKETINLEMDEFYTDQDIEDMGKAIEKVALCFESKVPA